MFDYYAASGVRDICRQLKEGDINAVRIVASILATHVCQDDVIVAMPNRFGKPGVMGKVCDLIASKTGCKVWGGLQGESRESVYAVKKRGVPKHDIAINFYLNGDVPSAVGDMFILDGVRDTGVTFDAACKLLPGAKTLFFAQVDKQSELIAQGLVEDLSVYDVPDLFRYLSVEDVDAVAFSCVRFFLRDHPGEAGFILSEADKYFSRTSHFGLRQGLNGAFLGDLSLPPLPVKDNDAPLNGTKIDMSNDVSHGDGGAFDVSPIPSIDVKSVR